MSDVPEPGALTRFLNQLGNGASDDPAGFTVPRGLAVGYQCILAPTTSLGVQEIARAVRRHHEP